MRYIPALLLGVLVLGGVILMTAGRAPFTYPIAQVSSAAAGHLAQYDAGADQTYYSNNDTNGYDQTYYSNNDTGGGWYTPSDSSYNARPAYSYGPWEPVSAPSYSYVDQGGTGYGSNPYNTYDYYDPYYYDPYPTYTVVDPWYVSAFPGFGRMAQYMIPGQLTTRPIVQPVLQLAVAPPAQVPKATVAQPSCWISAQPTDVDAGGSAVLSWSSFNTSHAILSDVGDVPLSGSRTISGIGSTKTFTLQVVGSGGSNSCYTRVTVRNSGSAPSCIISANPDTISRGQITNLAWGSQGAISASLGGGYGLVPTQSGITIVPYQSTTYTLTVTSASGQRATCSAQVNVQ